MTLKQLVTATCSSFCGPNKKYGFLNSSNMKYVLHDNVQSVYSYEDMIVSSYATDLSSDTLRMGVSKHHVRLS